MLKSILLYLFFKTAPRKRNGVDCDAIVQTVNAHLTVGKYGRLTNEITDYKTVALECIITGDRLNESIRNIPQGSQSNPTCIIGWD
jgi:hypothetical protein